MIQKKMIQKKREMIPSNNMSYEKYTKEKVAEKYRALPQVLKSFVTSNSLDLALEKITNENSLSIEKAGILENEVTLVILGFEKAKDFPRSLQKKIGLEKKELNKLLKDVDEKIFVAIRSSLRGGGETSGTVEKPPKPESLDREGLLASIENPEQTPEISTKASQEKKAGDSIDKSFLSENVAPAQPVPTPELRPAPRDSRGENPLEVPLNKIEPPKPETEIFGDKLNQKTHLPKEKSNLEIGEKGSEEKVKPDDGGKKVDPYREPVDEVSN